MTPTDPRDALGDDLACFLATLAEEHPDPSFTRGVDTLGAASRYSMSLVVALAGRRAPAVRVAEAI